MESLPQFALQSENNTLIGSWSTIAIASATFSIYNSLDGFYKILFQIWYKKTPMKDIPISDPLKIFTLEPATFESRSDDRHEGNCFFRDFDFSVV